MAGDEVGDIRSLSGLSSGVKIEVSKEIYNTYRENNIAFAKNFLPSVGEDEIYINFYTDCDYYINSIFGTKRKGIDLRYSDLKNGSANGRGFEADTLSYIKNSRELGTDGIKAHSAFRGWYFDAEFKEECVFEEFDAYKFTETVSLYAKWLDECVATIDWDTYKPEGAETKLYWTSEDMAEFPVITDRVGYDGVSWKTQNGNTVFDTTDLTSDVNIRGEWVLSKPTVDISIDVDLQNGDFNISHDKNTVTFTYDENRNLDLSALKSHALDGINYRGETLYYTYLWERATDASYAKAYSSLNLKPVADADTYTLSVTAHSPYGETSASSTEIRVNINRKSLDIGTAILSNNETVYNGSPQTLSYSGDVPVGTNIKVNYAYYNSDDELCAEGNGVVNADTYIVKAIFEKNNSLEAANYETKELTAAYLIKPKSIGNVEWKGDGTGIGWNGSSVIYDGNEHSVIMDFDGRIGEDVVDLKYEDNTGKNAGHHTAVVVGIKNNNNYSLDGISNSVLRKAWVIEQKEITVTRWQFDGNVFVNDSVTYDANTHYVEAVTGGGVSGENVKFLYSNEGIYVNSSALAGSYTAKITGVGDSNYYFDVSSVSAEREWNITKRQLQIGYTLSTLIYDGKEQAITATVSNFVGEDAAKCDKTMFDFSGNSSSIVTYGTPNAAEQSYVLSFAAVRAGSYNAALNGLASMQNGVMQNYSLVFSERSFTIRPKNISFTALNGSLTYNGTEQDLIVEVNGIENADLISVKAEQFNTSATVVRGEISSTEYRLIYRLKNAGSLLVAFNAFANSDYAIDSGAAAVSFTVNKKALNIYSWTATDKNSGSTVNLSASSENRDLLTYNYYGFTLMPKPVGVVEGEDVSLLITDNEKTAAGVYSSKATLSAATYPNYTMTDSVINWAVEKRGVSFNWVPSESFTDDTYFTYDGKSKAIVPRYSLLGEEETLSLTYSDNDLIKTDVGEYKITVSGVGNSNYTADGSAVFSWSIEKKAVAIEWLPRVGDFVYNGTYQGPTFKSAGLADSDVGAVYFEAYYSGTAVNNGTKTILSLNANEQYSFGNISNGFAVDAGTYLVSVNSVLKSGVVDNNYYVVESSGANFIIGRKTVTLSENWNYANENTGSGTYDGNTELIYNAKAYTLTKTVGGAVSRLDGGEDVLGLSYVANVKKDVESGGFEAKVSGITGSFADNYRLPDEGLSLLWKISPKPLSLDWVVPERIYNNATYSQYAQIDYSASADGDGKAYAIDEGQLLLSYSGETERHAGSYTAKVTGINSANYTLTGSGTSKEWIIKQRPVALSWSYSSTVYNGDKQYPTASYECNGETVICELYTQSGDDYLNVGAYTVTATKLSSADYTLDGTLGATEISCAYTITQREIELAWYIEELNASSIENGTSFVYDAKEKTVKARITNLVGSDEVVLTYSANTAKNVSGYTVSVTAVSNSNYKLNTVQANSVAFEITKRTVEISWSGDSGAVYDGNMHSVTATVTNVCEGDTVTVSEYSLIRNSDYGASNSSTNGTVMAGEYTVTAIGLNDEAKANYYLSTASYGSHIKELSIKQQPVTVSWSGEETLTYDKKSHYKTATVVGKNDGLSLAFTYLITNENNLSIQGNGASNAGTYVIEVNSLLDKNYYIDNDEVKSVSLTVNKKTIGLEWGESSFGYDGNAHSVAAVVTDYISGDTVTVSAYEGVVTSGIGNIDNNRVTQAGEYKVYAIGLSNNNYSLPEKALCVRNVTVSRRVIVITDWSNSDNSTYNGYAQSRQATTVKVASDEVEPVYEYTKLSGEAYTNVAEIINVGEYKITISALQGANAHNYTIVGASGLSASLNIDPKPVTLNWSENSLIYNGALQTITATVAGTVGGTEVTVTSYSGGESASYVNGAVNAGSYTVTATALSNSNYCLPSELTHRQSTLTISPAVLTVTWQGSYSNVYNGTSFMREASAGVLSAADRLSLTYQIKDENNNVISHEQIVNCGVYTILITAISGSGADNYKLEGCPNPSTGVSVTPKTVGVSWSNSDLVYDGSLKSFIATVKAEDTVNGDMVNVTGYDGTVVSGKGSLTSNHQATRIGEYRIYATSLDNQNYALPQIAAERAKLFTVSAFEITLSWSDKETVYDGTNKMLFAAYNYFAGDEVKLSYTVNGFASDEAVNSGVYVLTVSGLTGADKDNYCLSEANRTVNLTITEPITASLEWTAPYELSYDGTDKKALFGAEIINKGEYDVAVKLSFYNANDLSVALDVVIDGGSYVVVAELTGKDKAYFTLDADKTRSFGIMQ